MSLYITQCPQCKISFKLYDEQLNSANGKVRCGSCMHVFFAPDNFLPQPVEEETQSPSIPKADPQAMSELENEYLAEQEDDEIELVEADLQSTEEMDNELETEAKPEPEVEPKLTTETESETQTDPEPEVVPEQDLNVTAESEEELEHEAEAQTETELDTVTETKAELENETDAAEQEQEQEQEDDNEDFTNPLEGDIEEQEDEDFLPLEGMDEVNLAQSSFTEESSEEDASKRWQEPEIEKGSPVDDVFSLIKTDLRDNDERIEPDAFSSVMPLNDDEDDLEPQANSNTEDNEETLYQEEQSQASSKKTKQPSSNTGLWAIGVLLLMLAAIGQFAYFKFDTFSRHPDTRFLYQEFCKLTGCELPSIQDTAKMEIKQFVVRKIKQDGSELQADILLMNTAIYPQPYPDLTLIIRNPSGQVLASRRFSPKEFLSYRASLGDSLMPRSIPVRARLIIKAPEGQRASESVHIQANQ